jgi:hypothetical protein
MKMTTVEIIKNKVKNLPENDQQQVLDFILSLLQKTDQQNSQKDDLTWYAMSVEHAIHDLDEEKEAVYNMTDLKEQWN